MNLKKYVRWDMDGTFCQNTELLAFGGVREAMIANAPALANVLPDAMHLTKFAGYRTREVIEMILEEPYVKALSLFKNADESKTYVDKAFQQTEEYQLAVMRQDAQTLEGIEDVFAIPGTNHSIVSTSSMPRLLATMEGCIKNGLTYDFDQSQIFSADETVREILGTKDAIGKPNPTVYLLTEYMTTFQQKLAGDIDSDTMVQIYRIEDSSSGVKAAQGAKGMVYETNGSVATLAANALLRRPELTVFNEFLDNKGHRQDFINFMNKQTTSFTVGVTTATHIPEEQKAKHGQSLQKLWVDHLSTDARDLKKFIIG